MMTDDLLTQRDSQELRERLEAIKHYVLTPQEVSEQRISLVIGQTGLDEKTVREALSK